METEESFNTKTKRKKPKESKLQTIILRRDYYKSDIIRPSGEVLF